MSKSKFSTLKIIIELTSIISLIEEYTVTNINIIEKISKAFA